MFVGGRVSTGEKPRRKHGDGSIVLNATAEFCCTMGDIPIYGLAANRDEDAQELLLSAI